MLECSLPPLAEDLAVAVCIIVFLTLFCPVAIIHMSKINLECHVIPPHWGWQKSLSQKVLHC